MSDWIKTAKVGDKVVCIGWFDDHREMPSEFFINVPKAWKTYSIRSLHVDENGTFLLLDEVMNPAKENSMEPDFHASGFIPAHMEKTA